MTKKQNTVTTPESRHFAAAEKEFADGWVKCALWNMLIDGPDEISEGNKQRYLQLRAERLAIEEAKEATPAGNVEVTPYEVMLGRFGAPKLLSELPASEPQRFARPYFLFTSKRLIILSRNGKPETSSPPMVDFLREVELFWERARGPVTPNNNAITVRSVEAVVRAGEAISILCDEMHVQVKRQPLSLLDRLICADPAIHLDFTGKFDCGGVVREATLSIKPLEPSNEIERILRLLPIELAYLHTSQG